MNATKETKLGQITDSRDGTVSHICRVYRVDGAKLFLCCDKKIWIGYGEMPESFCYVGNLPAGDRVSKINVRRAANC